MDKAVLLGILSITMLPDFMVDMVLKVSYVCERCNVTTDTIHVQFDSRVTHAEKIAAVEAAIVQNGCQWTCTGVTEILYSVQVPNV